MTSDWAAPGTAVLARIPDRRVTQFWDPDRILSHAMGEQKLGKPVWDWIGIYAPGAHWATDFNKAAYTGRPVVNVKDAARDRLKEIVLTK